MRPVIIVELRAHYQRTLLKGAGLPREAMQREIVDFDAYPDGNDYPRYGWVGRVDFTGATFSDFMDRCGRWACLPVKLKFVRGSIEDFPTDTKK